ncbi:hypothetical protein CKA47_25670 [Pseudomonas aeruginosa]|uniref:hypothetical protein n=1 Tax=Pseudomonas aeruginosa TaxID=287 RepID=UPI00071B0652|nr:hypothetical protein [Pseudomonas aeruginosa]KSH13730.1 hypothetical protein AO963_30050 [Pseudomonas aeruginosa]RKF96098.1 hypothetical protein CKA44_35255 [Pseudomonas aeruginosa]RKG21419.1 hypothetical protein CKA47_25670 [Pseudomonas aeruginosa]RLR28301.1 hypothetical protein CKA53_32910 [Pseudomonas aeruginosa]RLR29552.1 hypothetical protein CKA50_34105 [Pseudomonas aeruginosa]
MTISNRFPSGASLDQVKKDAKKLAKSNGLSLHEALDQAAAAHGAQVPWHRIQEFLAGDDDETLLARFALPLYAGGVFTVSLTETRPMISVTGRTGAGKSTTALLIAERYLASCRGRVHLVSPLHVQPTSTVEEVSEGCWMDVWDRISLKYPGRCVRVVCPERTAEMYMVGPLDLSHSQPERGDLVVLDERYHCAKGQSLIDVAEIARMWRVGLILCKQPRPWEHETITDESVGDPFSLHIKCSRDLRLDQCRLQLEEMVNGRWGECLIVPGAPYGSSKRKFRFQRSALGALKSHFARE